MALVPNAPTVAVKSSTMLTLYVGMAADFADMAVKILNSPSIADAHLGWVQPALLVLMAVAAICRVIKQESISGPTPPPSPLLKE
jgi:hypothetical protein